jgi:ATP-dependent Lon protease
MPDQIAGVTILYASRIEVVLAAAAPHSSAEEKKDEELREEVLQHADA